MCYGLHLYVDMKMCSGEHDVVLRFAFLDLMDTQSNSL